MKIISLFSGCGGLDLGFKNAGFDVIWANEYDTTIHPTYRLNHPQTELCTKDIRDVCSADIPDCDGIIGGPPCQSWSLGGKGLGLEDDRGKLMYEYIRIVSEKAPKFFLMENVPGMLTSRHQQAFTHFVKLFQSAGYNVKYELINAADFKIPQERLRLIIVGIRKDVDVEYLFPSKTSGKRITLFQAIGDLNMVPRAYNKENVGKSDGMLLNHDYFTGAFDSKYMARNRVRGWNELSFTIQAQAKNAPLHPQAPKMLYVSQNVRKFVPGYESLYRRLSVRECARIQTFPDDFRFEYKHVEDGYKMVGNAVPPRLAYYLGMSVKRCFEAFPFIQQEALALIGYVKSDADFGTIRKEMVYYVRGGNRTGAIQYGQLVKPIKWLLLHRKTKCVLYELASSKAIACEKKELVQMGFKPKGNEYWLFKLEKEIEEEDIRTLILKQVSRLGKSPQIVSIHKK